MIFKDKLIIQSTQEHNGENNQQDQHSHHKISIKKHIKTHSRIIVLILSMVLITSCQSTQIQILSTPTNQQLKSLNLMKSLRRFRQRYINLKNQTYVCVTSIKQKPTNTQSSSSQKLKLTNLYLNGNIPTQSQVKIQPNAFIKQLDLLEDGIAVRHHTKQFIYGYKHKKIISQFDDQFTKYHNQKKQFQNFTMGIFDITQINNIQAANQGTINPNLNQNTYQNDHFFSIFNTVIPKTAQNILKNQQKPLSKKYAHQAIKFAHIVHQQKRIILTNPLDIRKHMTSKSYNITFQCQTTTTNNVNYIHQPGISITNFEIQLLNSIPNQCKKVTSIVQNNKWMLSFMPGVNIVNDKIVGHLDKVCEIDNDDGLHQGDYLFLETKRIVQLKQPVMKRQRKPKVKVVGSNIPQVKIQTNPLTGQATIAISSDTIQQQYQMKLTTNHQTTQFFVVQITKIIGQNVYKLNAQLPWTLKIKHCNKIRFTPQYTINYGGQLYLHSEEIKPTYYISNNQKDKIVKIQNTNHQLIKKPINKQLKTGDQLFCFTNVTYAISPNQPSIIYYGLTIGQQFGQNYYQVYPWQNIYELLQYDIYGSLGDKMNCLQYITQQKKSNSFIDLSNPISNVIKMSKNINNKIKFKQSNQDSNQKINEESILMITLSKDAVVEITTNLYEKEEIQTQVTQSDLVEETQPVPKQSQKTQKQQNFNKVNKKEIGTNKYYLTSQKIYKIETILKNKTKVRIQRIQNGIYENNTNQNYIIVYKGIWRAGDFVKFPRFTFNSQEQYSSIHIKYGSAFVRAVNLAQFSKQYYVVSSNAFNQHTGYGPMNRPLKSISTEHRFKWGTFCAGNVNKNRQALVKMKCGQSWYKLNSITQTQLCTYQIQIITQFLCDKNVVFPALKQGISTFSGSLCLPTSLYKQE